MTSTSRLLPLTHSVSDNLLFVILENIPESVWPVLLECCRHECKYGAKQTSDIIQYPMYVSSAAAMGL